MPTRFQNYVVAHYRDDLARFRGALGANVRPMEGVNLPRSGEIAMCDCAVAGMHDLFEKAGLADAHRFAVVASLEAALFAGVHCYDKPHFPAYCDALPWSIIFWPHGGGTGMVNPHILLAGVKEWGPSGASMVEDGCIELLPAWATAYYARFSSSGANILTALASDADLQRNPSDLIAPAAMASLTRGLRRAALLASRTERESAGDGLATPG